MPSLMSSFRRSLCAVCRVRSLVSLVLLAGLSCAAAAQTYPGKMLTLVVPWPAGGASDFVARLIQPELQRRTGQQLLVENIGGVSGALGVQKVVSASPDGHTQLLATPMELVLAPLALSAVKFKPEDLRLAGLLASTGVVMLVRKDIPANTIDEFLAWAKGRDLTAGNTGTGSLYHLAAAKFEQQSGLRLTHVPYKGGAPLMTDIAGGQLDMAFFPLAGPVPGMIKEGKVKALAMAAATPHPQHPAVPALAAHKRFPGFQFDVWIGVQVPRTTPTPVVARINQDVNEITQHPDVRAGLEGTGSTMAKPMVPSELDAFYASEIERYRALAKSIQLQPQ